MTDWTDGFRDASGAGPLEGIRVLDLGRYQAGPRCGLVFARLGADVIKIEPPKRGDESRLNNPRVRGQSAYWAQYNSGKRSLSLDLKSDPGKEILRDLVKQTDIFIQNFRPGVIDLMGFSYDILKSLNRRVVMVNISAYGQYGSLRDRVGFDQVGQAMSGLMSLNGEPDGAPVMVWFPLVDRITSLHAAIGALAAIHERTTSGEGQAIDVCLADSAYSTVEIPISAYLGDGQILQRTGNEYNLANMYETTDGYAYLASYASDNIFPRLASVLGHADWVEDSRFDDNDSRADNSGIVEAVLVNWFLERSSEDASDELNEAGVPCAPVNTIAQSAVHPHIAEREIMIETPDDVAGTMWVTGRMIKFNRSGMPVGAAPTVGQHSGEILEELLGKDEHEIATLRTKNVI